MNIVIETDSRESETLYNTHLQSGEEFAYFKFLEWDTEFFKKPSYALDMSKSNFEPSEKAQKKIVDHFSDSFITAKIDTRLDYKYTYFLQQCHFYYVDTEIKLQHKGLLPAAPINGVSIEDVSSNENLPIRELGEAFSLTRFHCDPHISAEQADRLWGSYLQNFTPSDTKKMYLAKVGGEIAGVILANLNETENFLFFVAVLEPYRSQKIGSVLMDHALQSLQNKKPVCTGTQAKNITALNFYIRNGFSKIVQTNTVMHYWS
ncbi:GCN5-related N-acetyltransferase [Sulfuricurvum kujiense DSM 16994]|uniref:GCN5-related N-acetyltransferase n=1 Tax=Sulfuricurvum kujiense (strain ATCC BAA-921 / DSM 16994 / JCM 11577 / YK-1) TaxID=709032 RepID=E4TYA5_SULKY|nr:GNAT family N-acetyltransferase [Sulfuricurvum kujiense]ADR35050.1 GCN5-related N-acetyltransferase [Sulfuricurvum kujiense DSM 16994]